MRMARAVQTVVLPQPATPSVRGAAGQEGYPKVVLDVVTGTGPADLVAGEIAKGRPVRALEDWPPIPGFSMYYPSRRHQPAALAALVNALRVPNRNDR